MTRVSLIYRSEPTTKKCKNRKKLKSKKKRVCSEVSVNNPLGSHGVRAVEENEGYGGKDLRKRKVLSLEWKSEGVMEWKSFHAGYSRIIVSIRMRNRCVGAALNGDDGRRYSIKTTTACGRPPVNLGGLGIAEPTIRTLLWSVHDHAQCRNKMGAIDVAVLGPFKKDRPTATDEKTTKVFCVLLVISL